MTIEFHSISIKDDLLYFTYNPEIVTQREKDFLDKLASLRPVTDEQVANRLKGIEATFIKSGYRSITTEVEQLTDARPVECDHYFSTQPIPTDKKLRAFRENQAKYLKRVLTEGDHYHLVYLGALAQVYGLKSRNTEIEFVPIVSSLLAFINNKIDTIQQKRLGGNEPSIIGQYTKEGTRSPDPRHTTKKHGRNHSTI